MTGRRRRRRSTAAEPEVSSASSLRTNENSMRISFCSRYGAARRWSRRVTGPGHDRTEVVESARQDEADRCVRPGDVLREPRLGLRRGDRRRRRRSGAHKRGTRLSALRAARHARRGDDTRRLLRQSRTGASASRRDAPMIDAAQRGCRVGRAPGGRSRLHRPRPDQSDEVVVAELRHPTKFLNWRLQRGTREEVFVSSIRFGDGTSSWRWPYGQTSADVVAVITARPPRRLCAAWHQHPRPRLAARRTPNSTWSPDACTYDETAAASTRAPIRSSRWSPTRSEFAIAVSAGFTAPMLGKTLVSTT
jgi:hypothetical protein